LLNQSVMNQILFVCTGNYYRSRFAEIIFNHLAKCYSIPASAFSRGLRLNPSKNKGVISPHATLYLSLLKIQVQDVGSPAKLDTADLQRASIIILLDEKEHRVMFKESFPDWEDKVEYWQFEDDYVVSPSLVLPSLKNKVENLAQTLKARQDISNVGYGI
jgi:protein-tyrosine phosphatase